MTTYNIIVNKDNPDDNDPLNDFTVTMITNDEDGNFIQQNGPGLNPSPEIVYLQNLLLRDDLTQDQIDMANAQINQLQQFLIDNPVYDSSIEKTSDSDSEIAPSDSPPIDPILPAKPPLVLIPKKPAPILPKSGIMNKIKNIFS